MSALEIALLAALIIGLPIAFLAGYMRGCFMQANIDP